MHNKKNQESNLYFTTEEDIVQTKECRICLEQEASGHPLIQPCKCSGTLQHVHEKCLKEWIMAKKSKNSSSLQCELCHHLITFSIVQELRCLSYEMVRKKISEELRLFILLMVGVGLDVGFILLLSWLLNREMSVESDETAKQSILQVGIAILVLLLLLFVYSLIRVYLIGSETRIENINRDRPSSKPAFVSKKVTQTDQM